MSDCYVNVCGGIGNQLFQVAAGYTYAKKYNKALYINVYNWTASQGKSPLEYENSIFKNFNYCSIPTEVTPINEKEFNYTELPYHDGDVFLNGYFQSLKYFEDYKNEFIDNLILPDVKTSFIDDRSMAFHIRRGDYLNFPKIFNVCNTEYFNSLFEKYKDFDINVFTDSPNHILREFESNKFRIIQAHSELDDLTIMANHRNVVCSNSSFSWWSTLLGVEKDIIIVPNKWLLDRNCEDIYYPNMIKYEF